jgi:SH3-like domain-containing protein
MPTEISPIPGTQTIVTQNVKIIGSNVNIRSEKNAESEILATLNTGDVLLRIEVANTSENGYYWDKAVLSDGRKGYVANNLIQKVNDATNCNESVIANTSVNLRNGPGTNGTSVITTLIQGQALTKIETGKYNNLDGYDWDRVKLADGRQGYIASKFTDKAGSTTSNGTTLGELIKVVTNIGINVREAPGTDKTPLTYVKYGETLSRVEKGVSSANGYTWDKIVTNSGVVGYIARGNSSENFIESVAESNSTKTNRELGDVNGDGKITPTDYSLIKDYIMGKSQLTEEQKKYADYNKDGKITPTDYALIKEYIMR